MIVAGFKTKKALKEAKDKDITINLYDPSLFGKADLNNLDNVPVVGPGAYERKWYAQITTEDGILTKVK